MRRNRQKLHRELRVRAEARKAEVRHHRERKTREREQSLRAFEIARSRARTAPSGGADVYAAEWPAIRNLLGLANVDADTQNKVSRLCQSLARHLPMYVSCEWLPWLLLLSLQEWVRPVERLHLPGGSLRRKREAVAQHLLTRYPVPPFLLRALDVDPLAVARVPLEDKWAVDVLAHVGRGGSLRDLAGTDAFPAPLTRAMCHLFLDATAETPPIAALRRAQVRGAGGPASLAARLMATRLGELHGPDRKVGEPYIQQIIGWLCRRPGLHDAEATVLDAVIAWALERHRSDERFSLEGRTEASVRREVERFLVARTLAEDPKDELPDAGVPAWDEGGWSVLPILRRRDLWEEGDEMHHCVAMYTNLVRKRKVAVYSLRREGSRVATIEVALGAGAVVQAKRFGNAPLYEEAVDVLRTWAEFARYRVASL